MGITLQRAASAAFLSVAVGAAACVGEIRAPLGSSPADADSGSGAADTTPPMISAFTVADTSTGLNVSGINIVASDDVALAGYWLSEDSVAPAPSAGGWSEAAPTTYAFSTPGSKTLYLWVKDAAGNLSAGATVVVTVVLPDVTAPVVTQFSLPVSTSSLVVVVTTLTASDAVGVTGYLLTEDATAPAADAGSWSASAPTSYTFSSSGAKTLYAWAKDAAGNVSSSWSEVVTVTVRQSLDEVLARKSRLATSTFYAGETGTPYYFWQPETLAYVDTSYGTEVWRVAFKPGISDNYSKEYDTQPFSYDGGKLGIWSTVPVWNSPNKRISGDPNKNNGDAVRWIMNTDGTKFRVSTAAGADYDNAGFNWAHTESAYFYSAASTSDPAGAKLGQLYRATVDGNNATTYQLLYDTSDGRRTQLTFKDAVTSADKWLVLQDSGAATWPTPLAIDSRRISFFNLLTKTMDSVWGAARNIGPAGVSDPYGELTPTNQVYFRGSSSVVLGPDASSVIANYYNYSPFIELKRKGSATDGGPAWVDWSGTDFGANDEIKILSDNASSTAGLPHNPYDNGYAGHISVDRWGHYASVGSCQDCNDVVFGSDPVRYVRWGNRGCPGRIVVDLKNNMANPPWYDASNTNYLSGSGMSNDYGACGQHASWKAWSDYTVFVEPKPENYHIPTPGQGAQVIAQNLYYKTSQAGRANTQAQTLLVSTEFPDNYGSTYTAYPRPAQSPDGTKVAFSTVLFHSLYQGMNTDDDFSTTAYAVAYYPYPAEIKSAQKAGANVQLTWDFNQGAAGSPNYTNPRTYTKRGWPNEASDRPPSPREIKEFRLWSSPDNATWSPIGTTTYGNRAGAWTEASWSYDVAQANSTTVYYALTSLEHSGLESRTLGNTWKVTLDSTGVISAQAQQSSYPADPGGKSAFYTTQPAAPRTVTYQHQLAPATAAGQYTIAWLAPVNASLVRYYNLYAQDGVDPAHTQPRRIASIAASFDYAQTGSFKYVDWAGAQDGTTRYAVTAVDYLGNESP